MTHTPEQQIRERLQSGDYRLTQAPEIHTLLARIDELTAERDEAEANIGEVNQLLADTLSRTKIAEQRAEDAARVADLEEANERRAETVAMCELLTAELAASNGDRERIAKFIDYYPEPGSVYDLATAVKDFVANESKAERDAERADVVRFLRQEAGVPRISPIGPAHGAGFSEGIGFAADAIERSEHKEKPNAKPE